MNHQQAMQLAPEVLRLGGAPPVSSEGFLTSPSSFLKDCAYAAKQIPEKLQPDWLIPWAQAWAQLYGDFEVLRAQDPMMAYRPANPTMLEFHQSRAYIRQARTGNRCGKTTAGYAEDYWSATGFHPYRQMDPWPASALIICGLPFSDYVARTFEKKMLYGEDGQDGQNPLTPMFPEGGKWLYNYNKKDHILTLACPDCAEAGKAGSCAGHHKKTTIALATSEKSVKTIESFSVRVLHLDEHVPEPFFTAGTQRVGDQNGYILVTATPLSGPQTWEERKLSKRANGSPDLNMKDPEDPESVPYTSLHWCSKREGGIVDHAQIRAEEASLDEFEREARIEGKPTAVARRPVFNPRALGVLLNRDVSDPIRGELSNAIPLVELMDPKELTFEPDEEGSLRIWKPPVPGGQYIIGGDTAAGLSDGDASCATVVRMGLKGTQVAFELVAQYHGRIEMLDYADELYKLGTYYNSASVVVELTGGYGRAVVEKLKKELCYWNLFRDISKGEQAEFHQDSKFGIDTSVTSKPAMLGIAQQIIKEDRFKCPCQDTLAELRAYEQTQTDAGNPRYGGNGMHDDRVMSVTIALAVAISHAMYDVAEAIEALDKAKEQTSPFWDKIDKELREAQEVL